MVFQALVLRLVKEAVAPGLLLPQHHAPSSRVIEAEAQPQTLCILVISTRLLRVLDLTLLPLVELGFRSPIVSRYARTHGWGERRRIECTDRVVFKNVRAKHVGRWW